MATCDWADHVRFIPLQTPLAEEHLSNPLQMPNDRSTAVLWDSGDSNDYNVYTQSTAILRLLLVMGFPINVLGRILLLIPILVRDFGYRIFAQNRGRIWLFVKGVTGIEDVRLEMYRDRIMGLDQLHDIPPSWGLVEDSRNNEPHQRNSDKRD